MGGISGSTLFSLVLISQYDAGNIFFNFADVIFFYLGTYCVKNHSIINYFIYRAN